MLTRAAWLPWALLAVAVALGVGAGLWLTSRLNVATAATEALKKAREAERVDAAGQLRVRDATVRQLRDRVAQLEQAHPGFSAAVDAAERAAPGAHPIAVIEARTADAPATGEARQVAPTVVQVDTDYSSSHSAPGAPDVLLVRGDQVHAEVTAAVEQYEHGTRSVAGIAECVRTSPEPRTVIHSGPFVAPLSSAAGLVPADSPLSRWGFGVEGTLSTAGLVPGLLLAVPELRPFGAELEPMLAAGGYPGRQWYARAGLVLRL